MNFEVIPSRRLASSKAIVLAVVIAQSFLFASRISAQPPRKDSNSSSESGLIVRSPKASQGYTLIAPLMSETTYLINMHGEIVHSWESDCPPGQSAYLLENGHLLRPGKLAGKGQRFTQGGDAGRIQEFTWDGELVWDFRLHNDKQLPHHDITRLPNGNILMLVWEKKSIAEMIAAGQRPDLFSDNHLLVDSIVEIQPTGQSGGKVIWEWHIMDHLIQDYDRTKAHYGPVKAHPELINPNFADTANAQTPKGGQHGKDRDDAGPKKGGSQPGTNVPGGYIGGLGQVPMISDWTHLNAIAYNPKFDQIMVTSRSLSEIWIIDHSTTTAEAASHAGGRSGKGGDLLYRWGNPRAYRAGKSDDQMLDSPHGAYWIPKGLPGEGHVLVFNNGASREYTSVDEIALPVDDKGRYSRKESAPFGPEALEWTYSAKKHDFFSASLSNAQRLANGNTLICAGTNGMIFEVTPDKKTVWKYIIPPQAAHGPPGHDGGPFKIGKILSDHMFMALSISSAQKKQLKSFQADIDLRVDRILTAQQKKLLSDPNSLGDVAQPPPGQLFNVAIRLRLNLTKEQKKQFTAIQSEIDAKFEELLTESQMTQLEEMKRNWSQKKQKGKDGDDASSKRRPGKDGPEERKSGREDQGLAAFNAQSPNGAPPAEKGRPNDKDGKSEPEGKGPDRNTNSVFMALRYSPDFRGLVGKELKPQPKLQEVVPITPKEMIPVLPREKQ